MYFALPVSLNFVCCVLNAFSRTKFVTHTRIAAAGAPPAKHVPFFVEEAGGGGGGGGGGSLTFAGMLATPRFVSVLVVWIFVVVHGLWHTVMRIHTI